MDASASSPSNRKLAIGGFKASKKKKKLRAECTAVVLHYTVLVYTPNAPTNIASNKNELGSAIVQIIYARGRQL